MGTARAKVIIDSLRKAAAEARPPDGVLLRRYAGSRDEAAFAALVRRHGPMVLAVCRRVLGHAQDAEEAFQAAFVVLARRAGALAGREAVAGWLYTVAYHAALAARASRRRRRDRERQVVDLPHPIVMPDEEKGELLALLDRELVKLPESHRLPLVLCELEGRSRKEAARILGLAEGTLSSRLARGRKMLARRMAAHGAAVSAAALAGLLASAASAAGVHGPLVGSTIRAASGAVPAGVAALAKGVMKAMLLTKLKSVGWGLLLAASLAAGAVAITYRPVAAQDLNRTAPQAPAAAPRAAPDRDELEALRLEVDALRLELKATKQRVKALEDQAQAHGPGAEGAPDRARAPGLPPANGLNRTGEATAPPDVRKTPPDVPGAPRESRPAPAAPPADGVSRPAEGNKTPSDASTATEKLARLAADVQAAAKRLQDNPGDPQALRAYTLLLQELSDRSDAFRGANAQKTDLHPPAGDPGAGATLTAVPGVVAMGQVSVDGAADARVALRGSRPFRITAVKVAGAKLDVRDDGDGVSATHVLTLTLKPSEPGELDGIVRVETDLPDGAKIEFHVTAEVLRR